MGPGLLESMIAFWWAAQSKMLTSVLGVPFRSRVSVFSSCPFNTLHLTLLLYANIKSSTDLKYRNRLVYLSHTTVCLFYLYFSPPAVAGIVPILVAVVLGGMVLVVVIWKNSRGECSSYLILVNCHLVMPVP